MIYLVLEYASGGEIFGSYHHYSETKLYAMSCLDFCLSFVVFSFINL